MNILAMYEGQQWLCPARVLTHLDDITAALSEQGIELLQLEQPLAGEQAELLSQSAAAITAKGMPAPRFSQPQERKGEPGYAEVPSQLSAEQVEISGGQWLLLCTGQARFCFALDASDSALVLACRSGDLLWIAQDMHWALVPAPGSSCRWLAMADSEAALNDSPALRSNLSELQLLDI